MKLVIDIPESIYDTIQADEMISREQLAVLQMHILNGTPLPKGHGRLVDILTVTAEEDEDRGVIWFDAPTIIEADTAESEDIQNLPSVNPQEPCDDEYIKVPKKALKYVTKGMVAYNYEWLKNHFDIERAVICGVQQSCGDAISRQIISDYVESHILEIISEGGIDHNGHTNRILRMIVDYIENMPSVTPAERTGHWINIANKDLHDYRTGNKLCFECSECKSQYTYKSNYCPNCGCAMVEPQESEG